MAMGSAGSELMDYVNRFHNIQHQRTTTDELIKDLLVHCEGLNKANALLVSQFKDAQLDLEDSKKSRRHDQQLIQELETQLERVSQDNDLLKNRNIYVVVLIDGDGLLFKESLVRLGVNGGRRAAYALRNAIAQECGEHATKVEVICRVVANVTGLAKAMMRAGCIDMESQLRDFTTGFTQSQESFDFVDVGEDRNRAEAKIKGAALWHLRNAHCKQVILGISHDASYAPFLDELLMEGQNRIRITLLEGSSTVPGLAQTGLNMLNLTQNLFRPEKLVDKGTGPPGHQPGSLPPSTMPLIQPTSSASVSKSTSPLPSYAGAIITSSPAIAPIPLAIPIQPKAAAFKAPPPGPAIRIKPQQWNPGRRGLDQPLQVNQTVLDRIKLRKDREKLCNNHYLRGPCAKGDECRFEHRYKPSADEKIAIAFLARLNPCTNGQDCELEACIYGHHCPSVRDGQCQHPHCRFEVDDHPPNTRFKPSYNKNSDN